TFWANYESAESVVEIGDSAGEAPDAISDATSIDEATSGAGVEDVRGAAEYESDNTGTQIEEGKGSASEEEEARETDDPQGDAMKEALAAARAEIEAAKDEAAAHPTARSRPGSESTIQTPAPGNVAAQLAGDLVASPKPTKEESQVRTTEIPQDLDPETRTKLKLLRRLNPRKSVDELLAQIANEQAAAPAQKQKRRRFWGK
ncbi:unnamed protein product, partial [marine sediment metagenome]